MRDFTPVELAEQYARSAREKAGHRAGTLLLLAGLAGMIIALAGATTSAASFSVESASVARLIRGLLFPFGLGMVIVMGAELFTGNVMLCIPLLQRKITAGAMLRNWGLTYLGNFAGALAVAAGLVWFGHLNTADGALAAYTIKVAAGKCALPFLDAVVLGFFCNVLVCMGVLMAAAAKDVAGKLLGAYLPVAFFIICGFEHSVANMFYVPAGLLALQVPEYAAAAAGVAGTAGLSWGSFVLKNLVPVTIGNILGGAALGGLVWACRLRGRT